MTKFSMFSLWCDKLLFRIESVCWCDWFSDFVDIYCDNIGRALSRDYAQFLTNSSPVKFCIRKYLQFWPNIIWIRFHSTEIKNSRRLPCPCILRISFQNVHKILLTKTKKIKLAHIGSAEKLKEERTMNMYHQSYMAIKMKTDTKYDYELPWLE